MFASLKPNIFKRFVRSPLSKGYCISSSISCGRVPVEGVPLYWERYGQGPHVVLCIPGLAGSVTENFHPVWNRMNMWKYTVIGLDPPGHGKSYPPEVDFLSEEYYSKREARMYYTLMKELGYEKYSVLGWSNGGTAALMMGGMYSGSLRKVISCNSPCRVTKSTLKYSELITDLEKWPPKVVERLVYVYGKAYLKKMLQTQLEFAQEDIQPDRGKAYQEILAASKQNQCPTLFIAGLKDFNWNPEAVEGLGKVIRDFSVIKLPNAGHIHLEFLEEFVKISEEFLDQ